MRSTIAFSAALVAAAVPAFAAPAAHPVKGDSLAIPTAPDAPSLDIPTWTSPANEKRGGHVAVPNRHPIPVSHPLPGGRWGNKNARDVSSDVDEDVDYEGDDDEETNEKRGFRPAVPIHHPIPVSKPVPIGRYGSKNPVKRSGRISVPKPHSKPISSTPVSGGRWGSKNARDVSPSQNDDQDDDDDEADDDEGDEDVEGEDYAKRGIRPMNPKPHSKPTSNAGKTKGPSRNKNPKRGLRPSVPNHHSIPQSGGRVTIGRPGDKHQRDLASMLASEIKTIVTAAVEAGLLTQGEANDIDALIDVASNPELLTLLAEVENIAVFALSKRDLADDLHGLVAQCVQQRRISQFVGWGMDTLIDSAFAVGLQPVLDSVRAEVTALLDGDPNTKRELSEDLFMKRGGHLAIPKSHSNPISSTPVSGGRWGSKNARDVSSDAYDYEEDEEDDANVKRGSSPAKSHRPSKPVATGRYGTKNPVKRGGRIATPNHHSKPGSKPISSGHWGNKNARGVSPTPDDAPPLQPISKAPTEKPSKNTKEGLRSPTNRHSAPHRGPSTTTGRKNSQRDVEDLASGIKTIVADAVGAGFLSQGEADDINARIEGASDSDLQDLLTEVEDDIANSSVDENHKRDLADNLHGLVAQCVQRGRISQFMATGLDTLIDSAFALGLQPVIDSVKAKVTALVDGDPNTKRDLSSETLGELAARMQSIDVELD